MESDKNNKKWLFYEEDVPLNEYVDIPNSNIKTLLQITEQEKFYEIIEGHSNVIKIENVIDSDLSYLYFVFKIVSCMDEAFEPPISDNNRLQISVSKTGENYNFRIFDGLTQKSYTLDDINRNIVINLQMIFRTYTMYMHTFATAKKSEKGF